MSWIRIPGSPPASGSGSNHTKGLAQQQKNPDFGKSRGSEKQGQAEKEGSRLFFTITHLQNSLFDLVQNSRIIDRGRD